MPDVFEDLTALDRLIAHPGRLAILTILEACRHADFLFLGSRTGLPHRNLSSHLAKLEAAGLISVEKSFRGKRPHTELSLTPLGRERVDQHWRALEEARKAATSWRRIFSAPASAS